MTVTNPTVIELPRLRRVRWAVRATLSLGVAASVVANVLHAVDNPISQAIAAWPPLALLLTVELISRVPVHRRSLAAARLVATAAIAGIAAWISYWHMAGVAARYGETGASAYLLPFSVDGLIVVASVCLVELAGRIRDLEVAPAVLPVPAVAEPAPELPTELLARATEAARRYLADTGKPINRDALGRALRVRNEVATRLVRPARTAAATTNGTPMPELLAAVSAS